MFQKRQWPHILKTSSLGDSNAASRTQGNDKTHETETGGLRGGFHPKNSQFEGGPNNGLYFIETAYTALAG